MTMCVTVIEQKLFFLQIALLVRFTNSICKNFLPQYNLYFCIIFLSYYSATGQEPVGYGFFQQSVCGHLSQFARGGKDAFYAGPEPRRHQKMHQRSQGKCL